MNNDDWWNGFWSKQAGEIPATGDLSPSWDQLCWKVNLELWEEVFAGHAPGSHLIECGCGSARVSQHFARKGYQCTMLDYSEDGLQLARSGFEKGGLQGRFMLGDINNLPLPENSYDIVFSGGVLEFFPDISRPIAEMVRVLKPGGLFAANIVPRKFSGQTIADWERTLAHSLGNLARGRVRETFKVTRFFPDQYHVNNAKLKDYVACCQKLGLENVTGLGISPFPALSLPKAGARLYARQMQALLPWWRNFDRSRSKWTEVWGMSYAIYGNKRSA
jgi:ubiquinone/menaquinone biosynthesis C-methylase UbiE